MTNRITLFFLFTIFAVSNLTHAQISTQFGPDGYVRIEEGSGGFIADLDAGDRFSQDHDVAGDVNGDGIHDIIIGARSDDDGATDAGATYIVFMNNDGTVDVNVGGGVGPGEPEPCTYYSLSPVALRRNQALTNAKVFLEVQEEYGPFLNYIWSFVDGKPIQNAWTTAAEVPAKTKLSDRMSKALKKKGFKFIGSTICYAFMQGVGMVNDHTTDCFRYEEVKGE